MTEAVQVFVSGAFGIAAGALSGFLGIGGGAILTPLLVLVLGFEQHRAQGISLAALLPPVGLPAVLAYRRGGVVIVQPGSEGACWEQWIDCLGAFATGEQRERGRTQEKAAPR